MEAHAIVTLWAHPLEKTEKTLVFCSNEGRIPCRGTRGGSVPIQPRRQLAVYILCLPSLSTSHPSLGLTVLRDFRKLGREQNEEEREIWVTVQIYEVLIFNFKK